MELFDQPQNNQCVTIIVFRALTLMFHLGTRLPWDWRLGPSDSSERAHLLEMLLALPPLSLIAADAGFVGYEYLSAIHQSGRSLLIRVGFERPAAEETRVLQRIR